MIVKHKQKNSIQFNSKRLFFLNYYPTNSNFHAFTILHLRFAANFKLSLQLRLYLFHIKLIALKCKHI